VVREVSDEKQFSRRIGLGLSLGLGLALGLRIRVAL
jgi:hypothetical protein